jgi:hypothetical protein
MEEWGRVLVAHGTATLEGQGGIPGVCIVGHRMAALPDRMEGHTSHLDGKAMVEAGYDAIHRCTDATLFEWPKGSALLFWNWEPEYQHEVQDGQPHFMTGSPEKPFMRKQSKAKDPLKHGLM